jgi:CheY-like chemotaxis protein
MRILIADDNGVSRKAAQMMLQKMGYCAEVAENGREVLERLQREEYDLLLLDLFMPELDGLETAWEIRSRFESVRQPRIYALTAGTSPEDEPRCLAAGMDGLLTKPLQAEVIRPLLAGPIENIAPLPLPTEGRLLFEHPHIAELFLQDTPQKIAAMHSALASHDSDQLRRSAHALKGSGYTVGAQTLANLCERIEHFARSGDQEFTPVAGFLHSVETEFDRLRSQIETFGGLPANLSPALAADETRSSLR